MIVVDYGDFEQENSGISLLECEITPIVRFFGGKMRYISLSDTIEYL